jgi:hypothetical protein
MPRKMLIPGPAATDEEHRLEQLEATIVRGLLAYEERNRLIVRMVEEGEPQARLVRRLNRVRERLGAATLSPDSIAATVRRVGKPL